MFISMIYIYTYVYIYIHVYHILAKKLAFFENKMSKKLVICFENPILRSNMLSFPRQLILRFENMTFNELARQPASQHERLPSYTNVKNDFSQTVKVMLDSERRILAKSYKFRWRKTNKPNNLIDSLRGSTKPV